jgi:Pyridoxamine 5'-phosphate oxidase
MDKFIPEEIAYLQSQRFGRLATVSQDGELHVVPVTFRYHPEHESIDIGGENLVQTKKYRDAVRHGRTLYHEGSYPWVRFSCPFPSHVFASAARFPSASSRF